jgi:uncharacterized protein YceK
VVIKTADFYEFFKTEVLKLTNIIKSFSTICLGFIPLKNNNTLPWFVINLQSVVLLLMIFLLFGCSKPLTKKSSSELHSGNISGYEYDDYSVTLKKGDQLSIYLDSKQLDVIIFSPINKQLFNNTQVIIDVSSEYVLRVLMPRSLARKQVSKKYQLMVMINQ